MKATFENFQLLADKELYEAMVEKYGTQLYRNTGKIAIKTNNSFASFMIAEKVGDKYKITPITSQNNERQSLQMEAYWTVLKEFPIKEFNDVPQFYKQWFVNRGLMKEGILVEEKKMIDVIQYNLEPNVTLYYPRPEKGQEKTFMYTDKKTRNVYKRNGKTIIFPMKDIYGISKYPGSKHYKSEKVVGQISEEADRDYKDEYKKFQSSKKSKKYRADLNKYNRDKGTYGNGDGKDASHKNGKISGFEKGSTNKGRREKSRLKKENEINEKFPEDWQYDFHRVKARNVQVWDGDNLLKTDMPRKAAQQLVRAKKAFIMTANSINLIGESKMKEKFYTATKTFWGDAGKIKKGDIFKSDGVVRKGSDDYGSYKYIDIEDANPNVDYVEKIDPAEFKTLRLINLKKDAVAIKKLKSWKYDVQENKMKITRERLREIIVEEYQKLNEQRISDEVAKSLVKSKKIKKGMSEDDMMPIISAYVKKKYPKPAKRLLSYDRDFWADTISAIKYELK